MILTLRILNIVVIITLIVALILVFVLNSHFLRGTNNSNESHSYSFICMKVKVERFLKTKLTQLIVII